ncbi:MAG: D-2-hydroxyacid dehydrogenase [Lentisphaeria bacterium]|nr:D-2-hydroxyacid dehydrogenase [Lentisphaeria bacterium]
MSKVEVALVSNTSDLQQALLAKTFGEKVIFYNFHQNRDGLVEHADKIQIVYGNVREFEFPQLKKLEWVHATWSGIDNILYPAFKESAVQLSCTKGQSSIQMAEYVLAACLNLCRGFNDYLHQACWKPEPFPQLKAFLGCKVLILGTGHVGQEVAKKLVLNGAKVDGFSRSGKSISNFLMVHSFEQIPKNLSDYDFVVNTLPHTTETDQLLDRHWFSQMQRGAGFINIGRGKTVVEEDLLEAVNDRQLVGAILDVTIQEPLPENHAFYQCPSIIVTGHRSWKPGTPSNLAFEQFIDNLKSWMHNKQIPIGLVNKELGY